VRRRCPIRVNQPRCAANAPPHWARRPKNPGIHEVRDPDTDDLLGRALNSWWPYIFDINTFTEPYLPTIDVLTAPPDHSAPAAPDLIGGIPTGPTSVRIEWLEPVDDIGVTRYEICRDGEWVCRTPLQGLDDTGLTPNSSYTYVVRALDGSGNVSVNSDPITVTTLSSEEGLRNGDFQIGLGSPIGWQTESFKPTSALDWELPGTGRDGSRCISIEAGSDLNDEQVCLGRFALAVGSGGGSSGLQRDAHGRISHRTASVLLRSAPPLMNRAQIRSRRTDGRTGIK
jgi:hypothetical protein